MPHPISEWTPGLYVQAERVPGWVKQNPHVLLGLVCGQIRAQAHRVGHGDFEVGDLEVQVDHHLLGPRRCRPHRTHVIRVVLNAEVRHAFAKVQGCAIDVLLPDLPPAQFGVEAGERVDVRRVQHYAPPVRPRPAIPSIRRPRVLFHGTTLTLRTHAQVAMCPLGMCQYRPAGVRGNQMRQHDALTHAAVPGDHLSRVPGLVHEGGPTLAELIARLGHSTPAAAPRYQLAAADRDRAIADALSGFAEAKVIPLRRASK